jgi:ABC-type transporter Mla subunit MlaD
MSDRTPEQVNQTFDRLLDVAAANTNNITANSDAIAANSTAIAANSTAIGELSQSIGELRETVATVAGAVETLALLTDQRLNRQDQIISMLSTYITGIRPVGDDPA